MPQNVTSTKYKSCNMILDSVKLTQCQCHVKFLPKFLNHTLIFQSLLSAANATTDNFRLSSFSFSLSFHAPTCTNTTYTKWGI